MRKLLAITSLLFLLLSSCKKSIDKIIINGSYTENNPVAGRSQLNFIDNGLVVKSETGSNFKDTFHYVITPGKILLTPAWTNDYLGIQFDFENIDASTIKIENLYPGIPEAPKSYIVYKK